MASSPVLNIANPVTNPTDVQLAQLADNICQRIGLGLKEGYAQVTPAILHDVAFAVRLLAQAILTDGPGTASSVGSVTIDPGLVNSAPVIPTSMTMAPRG